MLVVKSARFLGARAPVSPGRDLWFTEARAGWPNGYAGSDGRLRRESPLRSTL